MKRLPVVSELPVGGSRPDQCLRPAAAEIDLGRDPQRLLVMVDGSSGIGELLVNAAEGDERVGLDLDGADVTGLRESGARKFQAWLPSVEPHRGQTAFGVRFARPVTHLPEERMCQLEVLAGIIKAAHHVVGLTELLQHARLAGTALPIDTSEDRERSRVEAGRLPEPSKITMYGPKVAQDHGRPVFRPALLLEHERPLVALGRLPWSSF